MSRWRSPTSMSGRTRAQGVRTLKRVPKGHKFATKHIPAGGAVVKFGQIIGFATKDIPPGEWVHEHNCGIGEEHGAFERDYAFCEGVVPVDFVPDAQRATFQGFKRAERAGGDAQLCRHPHLGELLDHGRGVHRQGDRALGHPRRLSQHRRHRRAEAGQRLRHRLSRRDLRHAQEDHLGLCDQPEHGRRDHGRARLRGVPDPQAQGSLRRHRERDVPHHDDPGDRRHAEDGRGRRRGGEGDAADRQHGRARRRSRRRS